MDHQRVEGGKGHLPGSAAKQDRDFSERTPATLSGITSKMPVSRRRARIAAQYGAASRFQLRLRVVDAGSIHAMTNDKRTSPWVYVAIGCSVILGIIVVAVMVVGYMGYRWTKELEAGFKDPEKRQERVLELLNAPSVPEGYHPALVLSIPFLMDMAVLSDVPPNEDGEVEGFKERGFVYLQLADMGDARVELEDFFEGRTDIPPLGDADLEVSDRTLIERGEFPLENGNLAFAAYRGTVRYEDSRVEGVANFFMANCPDAEKLRFGIWFGPTPQTAEAQAEAADLSGTPADPEALRRFLSNFSLCGAR